MPDAQRYSTACAPRMMTASFALKSDVACLSSCKSWNSIVPPSPPPPGFFLGSRQRRRLQIIASDSRCIPATLAVLLFGCQRRLPCFSFEEIPVLPLPPYNETLPATTANNLSLASGTQFRLRWYLSVPLGTSRYLSPPPFLAFRAISPSTSSNAHNSQACRDDFFN